MRCLSCKYDLSNLTEPRCPECGRAFDPNDPATFFVSRINWMSVLRTTLLGMTLFFAILFVMFFYVERSSIHSEPHRNTIDHCFALAATGAGVVTVLVSPVLVIGAVMTTKKKSP